MSSKPRGLTFLLLTTLLLLSTPYALAQSPSPALDDALLATECAQTDFGPAPIDQAVIGLDIDPGANALACHGWVTCPSPKSCSGWSSFYDCDSPFCGYDSYCETKTGGDARVQPREHFRDCTLLDGSSCREYELYSFRIFCGCGGL